MNENNQIILSYKTVFWGKPQVRQWDEGMWDEEDDDDYDEYRYGWRWGLMWASSMRHIHFTFTSIHFTFTILLSAACSYPVLPLMYSLRDLWVTTNSIFVLVCDQSGYLTHPPRHNVPNISHIRRMPLLCPLLRADGCSVCVRACVYVENGAVC